MGAIHEITGRCHCGNIEYTLFSQIPKIELPIRTCDCSFCTKQGACYTSHPKGRLQVQIKDQTQVKPYRFGTETADAMLCAICGVYPLISTGLIQGIMARSSLPTCSTPCSASLARWALNQVKPFL